MSGLAAPDGARALFFAVAIACFLAAACGLAARAADVVVTRIALEAERGLVARVAGPEDADALDRAVAAVRAAPGVAAADVMSPERAAALVEAGGGAPLSPEEAPVVRLIEIEAEPGRSGADVAWAAEQAASAVGVTLETRASSGDAMAARAEAREVRRLSAAGAWAVAFGAALIVALVARGRAAAAREAIVLAADLGADAGQVRGAYAAQAAGSGFASGVLGALIAAAAALGVGSAMTGASPFDLLSAASPLDLMPLAAAPLAAALLAAIGAASGAGWAFSTAEGRR